MAKVIVEMTISLDGFVADQNDNAGRRDPGLAALQHAAYMEDAIEQTGAVLMGRRTPPAIAIKFDFGLRTVKAEPKESSLPVAGRSSFERAGRVGRTSPCLWLTAPSGI